MARSLLPVTALAYEAYLPTCLPGKDTISAPDLPETVRLEKCPVGETAPVPSPAVPAQVAPLDVETAPGSGGEIDYPEITALHAASALTSAEQVLA